MCDVVNRSNADFIKTSTGFSTGGATFEDVALMHEHMKNGKKVKASGGISGFEDGKKFIELGAERLGTAVWSSRQIPLPTSTRSSEHRHTHEPARIRRLIH